EGVQDAGARAVEMAEAPGELCQRLARGAAFEQDEQARGEARPVSAGLAVDQRGLGHRAVDFGEAQDAVLVRRAAALERRVDMHEADLRRRLAREREPHWRWPRRLMSVLIPWRLVARARRAGVGWLQR